MDQKVIEQLLIRLPELVIFTIPNWYFLIQLRKMSVEDQRVKRRDDRLKESEEKYDILNRQYQQVIADNHKLQGEINTYKHIQSQATI